MFGKLGDEQEKKIDIRFYLTKVKIYLDSLFYIYIVKPIILYNVYREHNLIQRSSKFSTMGSIKIFGIFKNQYYYSK